MSDENDNGRPARPSLTLKPRTGSVNAGVVKQTSSHGRSKTVVVETKRVRTHSPGGGANLAGPSAAEKRTTYDPRPAVAGRPASTPGGLSAEEHAARHRAIDAAREAQERQAAQARAEAAARAQASAPAPAAAAPAAPAPAAPLAAAPTQAPAPTPAPAAPS